MRLQSPLDRLRPVDVPVVEDEAVNEKKSCDKEAKASTAIQVVSINFGVGVEGYQGEGFQVGQGFGRLKGVQLDILGYIKFMTQGWIRWKVTKAAHGVET
jgi:hypothetical protein